MESEGDTDSATFRTFARRAVAAAVVAWSAALVAGGDQVPDPPAAVFTMTQAKAGKAAYTRSCASCHMPDLSGRDEIPALAGAPFREIWGARSTKELFDYMSAAMPYGASSLSVEQYEAITAYVLQFNGAVTGEQALSSSTVARIDRLTKASAEN